MCVLCSFPHFICHRFEGSVANVAFSWFLRNWHDYSVVVTVASDISDPRFFISRRSLTASREGPDPSESEEVTS